jgi:N utilization substance protein A
MVVSELRGEKIDIIPWNPEPARFVAKALSPARVREVYLDDEGKEATVVVPDDQLALAIGKEGMNARLAARLTGWKIDIQSDTEFAQAEAAITFGSGGEGSEDISGRCSAILSNGKRCPNAALPGSRFCGVAAHQALEGSGSDRVGGPLPEDEVEVTEVVELVENADGEVVGIIEVIEAVEADVNDEGEVVGTIDVVETIAIAETPDGEVVEIIDVVETITDTEGEVVDEIEEVEIVEIPAAVVAEAEAELESEEKPEAEA